MRKYLQVIKGTIEEYMTYRLNFLLWRVRWVMQRLVVYFLWWAILSHNREIFGYTQSMMLTYIMLSNIVGTVVISTTTMEISSIINQGDLSNFLIRPVSFIRYYIARDAGDKLLNILFSIAEVTFLFIILRPPVFLQTDPVTLALCLFVIITGVILYFFFSLILSFLGFWTTDVWAIRFLSFVIMDFFAGGLFPLDILPKPLYIVSQNLPFPYFIYFPLKVYLGQLAISDILKGILVSIIWIIIFFYLANSLWRKGLKYYEAQGR